ncbi:MAG TPA: single-stranded-DNA-specific exonuclease RecJ [Candidatus Limnocylindria bacterium]|nr:single-stranded-DNA-specific exonuclease RecJ [Candidatus Limnocylindria bacterium]
MPLQPRRKWVMPRSTVGDVPDGIPPLVARILRARGHQVADMRGFLDARPTEAGPPMLDLDRAVERIRGARARRERIVVYGDYDVDGITGTAVLVRAMRAFGAAVPAYIPDRYEEGYGLNAGALRRLAADGASLVITVDCGVTAVSEAALARELGIDLIVTDHHHPPAVLPEPYALVNPRRPGDPSPHKDLAGAGVALMLARGLLGDIEYALREDELLQLVALATVADVVPLRGENRVLTRRGLERLNRAPLVGVRALAERAGLKIGRIGASDIGFGLGPRLNAAGRIADAMDALRLLLTEDVEEARALADRLEDRNAERQRLTQDVIKGARERCLERPDAWMTLVGDPSWPAGIVGLAASRLVEDHGRPAAVIAIDGAEGKGSCRSIPPVHIAEVLAECGDLLTKHGGHAMAAGFSVPVARIGELAERLDAAVRARLRGVRPVPTIAVDAEIDAEALTPRLALELADIEPCGAGNPRPRLLLRDVKVYGIRQVGADADHLRCKVTVGRFTFDAMAFRRGDGAEDMTAEGRMDAIVTVGTGLRGFVELELQDFGSVGTAAAMERGQLVPA